MKRFLLIPLIIAAITLLSGQPRTPPQNEPDGIDSIVVYSTQEYPTERIYKSIGDLRAHIDSMNSMNILYHQEISLASEKRDSAIHAMLWMTVERNRLKDENREMTKAFDILKKYPDYLMLLVIVIAGTLIGQGVRKTYINWKHNVE